MENQKKVFIIYHSGYGHTKVQAEAVLSGASSVDGIDAELIDAKEAAGDLDKIDQADAIIFGSPTYRAPFPLNLSPSWMPLPRNGWRKAGRTKLQVVLPIHPANQVIKQAHCKHYPYLPPSIA